MAIVNKRQQLTEKTQFGAKISKRVLEKLKAYSEFVQQPINYCADRLLDYALENDLEFRAYLKSKDGGAKGVTEEQAWKAFLVIGRTATKGQVTNGSTEHDKYLYGHKGKPK